jgi:DNA-binding PadR family transcriptional regulator
LTVLFMLASGPIHPYEMQRRIKLWGKDQVVNVAQRASLYKTIERLHEAGLIAVRQTERDQRFPERTVYELTDAGLRTAHAWLEDMLAQPRNEFPQFPAALSFIMVLFPEEARDLLSQRAAAVEKHVRALKKVLSGDSGPKPPRVALLETEYLLAMAQAELAWLRHTAEELRSGALRWSQAELAEAARSFL